MAKKVACHHCGMIFEYEGVLARAETCAQCSRGLKVCRNCLHYDRDAHHQCREPQAEEVTEKDRSNACDYFNPRGAKGADADAGAVRRKLDALFGGAAQSQPAAPDPQARLDALFKKK